MAFAEGGSGVPVQNERSSRARLCLRISVLPAAWPQQGPGSRGFEYRASEAFGNKLVGETELYSTAVDHSARRGASATEYRIYVAVQC